jgi:hypothetical protein
MNIRGKDAMTLLLENDMELLKIIAEHPIVEALIAERVVCGEGFVDAHGYDGIVEDTDMKVEVKFTGRPMNPNGNNNTLRIQSFQQKRGLFDFMHIVDGYNGKEYVIPALAWWKHVGNREEFHWSASDNATDGIQPLNTKFLRSFSKQLLTSNQIVSIIAV